MVRVRFGNMIRASYELYDGQGQVRRAPGAEGAGMRASGEVKKHHGHCAFRIQRPATVRGSLDIQSIE